MNHFPDIKKVFTKELVFSSTCDVKNISEDGGVTHEAIPVHLQNQNTVFFVSGTAGVKTKEHTHHHSHWMVVQEGEIEFHTKSVTKSLKVGEWVFVPSEITHHVVYKTDAKVLGFHHVC